MALTGPAMPAPMMMALRGCVMSLLRASVKW
jgi:hypothetical protein